MVRSTGLFRKLSNIAEGISNLVKY